MALDCPTKLFYTRKPKYENQIETDTFLQALAQGGFQVEELARMQYPEGIATVGDNYNYDLVVARTNELLKQKNAFIFELAFLVDGLFIRVDILVKKGNNIQLIDSECKILAEQFNFSGGQIDNVFRKKEIHEIIHGKMISFNTIISFCEEESLSSKHSPIWFGKS